MSQLTYHDKPEIPQSWLDAVRQGLELMRSRTEMDALKVHLSDAAVLVLRGHVSPGNDRAFCIDYFGLKLTLDLEAEKPCPCRESPTCAHVAACYLWEAAVQALGHKPPAAYQQDDWVIEVPSRSVETPSWPPAEADIEWIEDGVKVRIKLRDADDNRLYRRISKVHRRALEPEQPTQTGLPEASQADKPSGER